MEISRRNFIKTTAFSAMAAMSYKAFAQSQNKPNIALIGLGVIGKVNYKIFSQLPCNIVAICDINPAVTAKIESAQKIPFFTSYKEMFSKMGDKIDGVVISTPDHQHFPIAKYAISQKKHVYLEKPMCRVLDEVKALKQLAAENPKLYLQLGIQSHSRKGIRICSHVIRKGILGDVKRVIAIRSKSWAGCAMQSYYPEEPIPQGLDWKGWLGENAEYIPYNHKYVDQFWRPFWRFSNGAIGDISSHILDIPFYALELEGPFSAICVNQVGGNEISIPMCDHIRMFANSKFQKNSPVQIDWYAGFKNVKPGEKYYEEIQKNLLPIIPDDIDLPFNRLCGDGQIIIGTKGVLYSPAMHLGGKPVLLPRKFGKKYADELNYEFGEKIEKDSHHLNWLNAICGKGKLAAPFEYGANLTTLVLTAAKALKDKVGAKA